MNNEEHKGITLLKKGHKGLLHIVFSRIGLILLLLVLQVLLVGVAFYKFGEYLPWFYALVLVLGRVMVLYLLNNRMDPSVKVTWLIVFMLLPIVGVLLFWYTQSNLGHRALRERVDNILAVTRENLTQDPETAERLTEADPGAGALARYLMNTGGFPVYDGTDSAYFPLGEDMWEEMLRQLEQAQHFIFMEYFIVDEGEMWGQVLEILARKAKAGVEVRLMYDGFCELSLLPRDYPKRLEALGIRCKAFSPVTPFLSTHYNYRDHRKIMVIDGQVAFTGGVNLADEYINRKERFGHWKDTAVMVRGKAVQSFTLMFLQMWSVREREPEDFQPYLTVPVTVPERTAGFVIPYGDCPLDRDKVGEMVYIDILNRAQKYVHIMTPYLILDGELETALKFAAERGVEVTLILPGIPDKPMAYALAKGHYRSLLDSGVHIYEYTPGFVHAKVFAADGREAVVGTINLDYRSLYHHFECAAYLHGADCLPDIEADFQDTLAKCREVTYESVRREKWTTKALGVLLKAIAPLM